MANLPVEDHRSISITKQHFEELVDGVRKSVENVLYEPFVPLGDRVLIRRVEDKQKSKLGLPDKYRQQTNKGEIVAVGELVTNLKPGDRVLFGEYNAERFQKDDEELWIVRYQFIRGVERLKENL
jgi:chaperonin GroES